MVLAAACGVAQAQQTDIEGHHRQLRLAKNADEGKVYTTATSNNDAEVQFEHGFFPYDPTAEINGYYWQGKIFCFVLMFFAELGDKTFLMTMIEVGTGVGAFATLITAVITLCGMHVLASLFGWAISFVVNGWWVKVICTGLFIAIGLITVIVECVRKNKEEALEAIGATPTKQ